MNNKFRLVLIGIFLLAFFLRFYKLGEVPYGFYQDESAIGYNAFSLIETGKDEHGNTLPLYFKSFGDYKLPVYIYTSIIPIKLFGLSEFAVRLPSALFSFFTVVVFFFFTRALTKNEKLALVATALMSVNPWHLHYSRATFEVSIGLFLFVVGTLLLSFAFLQERKGAFLFGTLAFIISLYSYNLTRLLAPALYLVVVGFYAREGKRVNKKELAITGIVSVILLVPFVVTLFGSGGVSSAAGTFIFSSAAVKAPLLELRSYLATLPTVFTKLFFNTLVLTLWQYLQNLASYFSVSFFFLSGSTHGNHGIGNVGQFYLFELPLVLLGIWRIIQERMRWGYFFILWAGIVVLSASLTREAPHATRSFFLIVPLVTFSAFGVVTLLRWIQKVKNNFYKLALISISGLFVLYNLIYYFTSYYVHFPISYAKAWRSQDKDLSLFLLRNEEKYDKIIFDKKAGFVYTSLLFYQRVPAAKFLASSVYSSPDSEGFTSLVRFGKYEFRDIDWAKDYETKEKVLLITGPLQKPEEIPAITAFLYPKRPVVLAIKQEIAQYPVEEIAYVVVESK